MDVAYEAIIPPAYELSRYVSLSDLLGDEGDEPREGISIAVAGISVE